jgi:hypothetical protein
MRSKITAHLPEDLAAIYDATLMRRGEIGRERLERGVGTPEPSAVTAEAERLDAVRDTLRNPEAGPAEIAWARRSGVKPEAAPGVSWLHPDLTHLSQDLAELHAGLQARRAEVAWQRLTLSRDDPERTALRAEAEDLDAGLDTLGNPESTQPELDWVRNWGGSPEAYALTPDTWTSPVPAAETDAPEMELEAAI